MLPLTVLYVRLACPDHYDAALAAGWAPEQVVDLLACHGVGAVLDVDDFEDYVQAVRAVFPRALAAVDGPGVSGSLFGRLLSAGTE